MDSSLSEQIGQQGDLDFFRLKRLALVATARFKHLQIKCWIRGNVLRRQMSFQSEFESLHEELATLHGSIAFLIAVL